MSCLIPFHVLTAQQLPPFQCPISQGTCILIQLAINIGLFIIIIIFFFEDGTGNFYSNLLQLIFGFYSPYLKKMLEMISFGLDVFVTSKQNATACKSCAGETEDMTS